MNRETRVALAQQTLEILNSGHYVTATGHSVNVRDTIQNSIHNTILYRPSDFPAELAAEKNFSEVRIEVTAETSLEAAARIIAKIPDSNPLCLNFASAKNPGGGFLNGSQAQEESLARSSGLYASLLSQMEMYSHNRHERSCLYSDHMIYSPNVPVFRNDDGALLENPFNVSFITAPAANAGAIKKNEPQNVKFIQSTMNTRLRKLLWVAAQHNHPTLILGAWGCGVFQNNPIVVANLFAETLGEGGEFYGCFEKIVYAVFDRTAEQETLRAFQNTFALN